MEGGKMAFGLFTITLALFLGLSLYRAGVSGEAGIRYKKDGELFARHYDETDDPEKGIRSNLTIYTDHGTGCQYISSGLFGITPRLDKDGKVVCKKAEDKVSQKHSVDIIC